jgi:hypothetical protein
MSRVIVWYSDGAASSVAARLAVEKYGNRCEVVKCDTTGDEHPDNLRFRREVEAWIGREVKLIRSDKYDGVDAVFERRPNYGTPQHGRFMVGIQGAICTTELKKLPRYAYQQPDDVHVFGYTADEARRIATFEANNPELRCAWLLRDCAINKNDCYRLLNEAGIRLPAMYALGFDHNNCLGCVKATSPAYWNRVRRLFPAVFQRRAEQSRAIGCRLVRVRGIRIFLDELPPDAGAGESDGNIECGPFCEMEP